MGEVKWIAEVANGDTKEKQDAKSLSLSLKSVGRGQTIRIG